MTNKINNGKTASVEILGYEDLDLDNDNVDVYVKLDSGREYVATFFTLENIRSIMDKDKRTGESLEGLYFWATELIIVKRLDRETIEATVEDLLRLGHFPACFSEVVADDDGESG